MTLNQIGLGWFGWFGWLGWQSNRRSVWNRKCFGLLLQAVLLFALSLWAGERSVSAVAPAEFPNIIVMMADDMGLGDTSSYQDWTSIPDDAQVRTPNMERLARMGIRFTDAHSPSSRCTATRYALLTGRYSWRTRLKYSVLWGPQGDPLIEPNRPTIATMLQQRGYATGMSGKWHVGLTYRNSDGQPAESYEEVDLRQGIADGPLQHGFDFFHGTSRSHPTSRTQGWLFGDQVPAATGAKSVDRSQYVLTETGVKNFAMAKRFMTQHLESEANNRPFFLYDALHSNHGSYDPCVELEGVPVKGQSHPGGRRSDFIYENDVALGRLLEFLNQDDPRCPGQRLLQNTLIIFTSDNGADRADKSATGPLRGNKGSVFEGGHRIPFIATWQRGGIGDGDDSTSGKTSETPISLVDLFATFAEITSAILPDNGAEDSESILNVLRGKQQVRTLPLIHHDHKEGGNGGAKHPGAAWLALRLDNPEVAEQKVAEQKVAKQKFAGKWKLLVDEGLLLRGEVNVKALFELNDDLEESQDRKEEPALRPLREMMARKLKLLHDRGHVRTMN